VWNPDGQADFKVSATMSHVHEPSVLCCPDGHPDDFGILGIENGVGV